MYLRFLNCLLLFNLFISNTNAQNSFIEHYECLKTINSQIKDGDWKLEQHFETTENEFYSFYMNKNDTVYNLSFYNKFDESLICKEKYLIVEFIKKYSDCNYNYKLLMDTDTLYFYKSPLNMPDNKIFVVGKYYYLFSTPSEKKKFNDCQFDYFYYNMDSLIKVRGNNLPELPCLPETVKKNKK